MKILFSPVGMTDPMTEDKIAHQGYYDGALLHICRYEQPDLVYLYMSKETLELDALDGRYSKSMELVQTLLREQGKELRVEKIKRPELVEVQLFDLFLKDFQKILTDIRQEYPDAELLVNVSSGTPAMKSALQILSAVNDIGLHPRQVSTPTRAANNKIAEARNIQAEWDANVDNKPESSSRMTESDNINLLYEFNKKLLISLIRSYDYTAARLMADQMPHILPAEFRTLLNAAIHRINLKPEKAAEQIRSLGFEGLIDANPNQIAEYFLLLDIHIKKQAYTDYLRAITPFVLELFYCATEKQCGITLTDYTQNSNRFMWDTNKLDGSVIDGKFHQKKEYHKDTPARPCWSNENGYKYAFPVKFMLSWHLSNLCENLSQDKKYVNAMVAIRRFEEDARNLAAHTICSFTEMEIQQETGYPPTKMHEKMFRFLTDYTDIPVTEDTRKQYDRMNEKLISLL